MSRPNDIGGKESFGPIDPNAVAVFHEDWERRTFALCTATGGDWTIDMFRGVREHDEQAAYLSRGYWENWLVGLERLVAGSRLAAGPRIDQRPDWLATMMPVPTTSRPARFKVGDRVRVVADEPRGHTRRPAYVHGRSGHIVADRGVHRFADRSADGVIEGQQLYTVSFDPRELWGDRADGKGAVLLDLWDGYLEPEA